MDLTELDQEIILIRESINELSESKDYGALELAYEDLSYFISLLSN